MSNLKDPKWIEGAKVGRIAAYKELKELIESDGLYGPYLFDGCHCGNISPADLMNWLSKKVDEIEGNKK